VEKSDFYLPIYVAAVAEWLETDMKSGSCREG
jgi:hypothetical protein